jgi:hypothetical protein
MQLYKFHKISDIVIILIILFYLNEEFFFSYTYNIYMRTLNKELIISNPL